MSIQNMANSIYNLYLMKRYLKYIIIILIWLMYYFGVFTHFFELDYNTNFSYPLEINISKCVMDLQLGNSNQPSCISINELNHKLLLSNNTKCDRNDIRLLILVKSSLEHFDRRRVIRQTWGFENRFSDVQTRTIFILGRSNNINVEKLIDEEHKQFGDIVQYDFIDEYYNNTIKTINAIKWASKYCNISRFYFFSDDDMYVSIKNVLRYLRNPTEYPEYLNNELKGKQSIHDLPTDVVLFTGYVFQSFPLRHQTSKWYVSLSEYPFDMWPPYVTAGAYALSRAALIKFYFGSLFTKRFRFDDIYLGLVAKKLNIEPLHCNYIYFYKKHYSLKDYKYIIASHGYDNSKELFNVWSEQKSNGNA